MTTMRTLRMPRLPVDATGLPPEELSTPVSADLSDWGITPTGIRHEAVTPISSWELLLHHVTIVLREQGQRSAPTAREHPAAIAARDLSRWLLATKADVVASVGLAESSLAYWRNVPTAEVKPNKAGLLLRLHAIIGLLVAQYGDQTVRAWLQDSTRRDARGTGDAYVTAVERDGYAWLRRAKPAPRRTFTDADWESAAQAWREDEPEQLHREVNWPGRSLAPEAP
ncbi:hypothetical protein SAMN05443575_1564 [Jatrophihabitans endophyticus]|uniref:Uncharacterized protein n=1 Tax=Jatrophihabitans endophyticus TaxID=1206085 RepID=A0A1M5HM03_9ACTN|nr:hypothetical protein [Jatrophihabitans endophyticus]SHG16960.1 hypothetical protein SAMN05443575_1564 [Jatrophihabitans endophyticus]